MDRSERRPRTGLTASSNDAMWRIVASACHHFPSKADLAAAVAKRYWEDSAATLEALSAQAPDGVDALRRYPDTFRKSLENDNRMCLSSFMAAEYDDLPDVVKKEVQAFADVNVAWLEKALVAAEWSARTTRGSAHAPSSPPWRALN
jgi:AcrR family transcriptional regulator